MGSISSTTLKISFFKREEYLSRFQSTWFTMFSSWLEYLPTSDEAYYLSWYLFSSKPAGSSKSDVCTRQGFRSCKMLM